MICGNLPINEDTNAYVHTDRSIVLKQNDHEVFIAQKDLGSFLDWLLEIHEEDFTEQPTREQEPTLRDDVFFPKFPHLLVYHGVGKEYELITCGDKAIHRTTRGILFNVRRADLLFNRINGEFHTNYCGVIDKEGTEELNTILRELRMPFYVCQGEDDIFVEGWVEVRIGRTLTREWEYLENYIGRPAVLIWDNCTD